MLLLKFPAVFLLYLSSLLICCCEALLRDDGERPQPEGALLTPLVDGYSLGELPVFVGFYALDPLLFALEFE